MREKRLERKGAKKYLHSSMLDYKVGCLIYTKAAPS